MKTRLFLFSMLGLAAIPARATMNYYNGTSGNTQYSNLITMDNLVASSLETIGTNGSLVNSNHEYDDTTTGIKIYSYQSNGTTLDTFSISLPPLTTHNGGDLIKIVLPANVFAFEVSISFTNAPGADVCFEAASTFSSSCSGNQTASLASGTPTFFGVVSDTAITTIWIGESNQDSFTPEYQIKNTFSDATGAPTPEGRTLLMFGSGLMTIGMIRFRGRRRPAGLSSQC